MGIELELAALLFMLCVGMSVFVRFEVETPAWRKLLKWAIIIFGTLGLYAVAGHWSLIFPVLGMAGGGVVHVVWCRKHSIHPVHATPRRKYYELRGWTWPD